MQSNKTSKELQKKKKKTLGPKTTELRNIIQKQRKWRINQRIRFEKWKFEQMKEQVWRQKNAKEWALEQKQ